MEMKQICMSLVRIHDLHKLGTTWNSDSRYIKTWPKTWLWHILNMLIVMHIWLQKSYKQIVLLVRAHCQVYNPIFTVHYYHHIFWHFMHTLMNKGDFFIFNCNLLPNVESWIARRIHYSMHSNVHHGKHPIQTKSIIAITGKARLC